MPIRIHLLLLLLLSSLAGAAQSYKPADYGIKSRKALDLYEEGMLQARYRDREKAMMYFNEALKIEPDFAHAHYQVGVNAWVRKKYDDALTHVLRAYELRREAFPGIEYYLGESYFWNARYAEAIPYLETFLSREQGRKEDLNRAARTLRHARFAAVGITTPVAFEPQNLGEAINSERDEYLPCLTADDTYLLFTARRPEAIGGYNRSLGDYSEDFYYATYQDGAWSPAQNLGEPINTPENEGAATVTQDGKIIFFTACNLEDGLGNCDIYMATRKGSGWSKPENMGDAINGDGWDSQPCLSPDGKTLFFCSSRAGGLGGRDIWFSQWVQGAWTPAQNLGAPVNSIGNEDSPFLHADGITLYFSSDFHPGFGSQDLFVTHRQEDGTWEAPKNLGYPLNTLADESNIFVNASGRQAFINSDRPGGLGRSDLYTFALDPAIRPKMATFLRGLVLDSISRVPVSATLRLVDVETGDTIREIIAGKTDGRFLMSLPLEREYAAFATAPGYLFTSQHFYLKDMKEERYFDLEIPLSPIRKGVQVVLNNIFFESGSFDLKATSQAELAVLIAFMQEQPGLSIEIQGHTDNVGNDQANLKLSQQRADAVRDYLLAQGVAAARVQARGYGEALPVADNATDEGRARNRRTEFKILATKP
ncbi:MAG: OmpA family protein [Bacteroidia bacterium]|nr:OmpA family protein [Bacteroidia bacterium]